MLLKDFPYKKAVELVDLIKKRYYTVSWGDRPAIFIEESPEELETFLREYMHGEGMLQAYYYEGEELNIRIPWGIDDEERQLELHIRARTRPKGTEVIAHLERSRYEHKEDHINEVGYDVEAGMKETHTLLEDSDFKITDVYETNGVKIT